MQHIERLELYDAIERFRQARRSGRISPATIKGQNYHLRALAGWLADTEGGQATGAPTLADFNKGRLFAYLEAMNERDLRPRTVRAALHALRAFGRWAVLEGYLPQNDALALPWPKLDPSRRKHVTDEELFALLDGAERIRDDRRSALVKAVLSVLIFTGLRRSECLDLLVSDVDMEEGCLHVRHGKGDKPRDAYLPEEAKEALRVWLAQRGPCGHDYLWDFQHARRINKGGLVTILREARHAAGLADADHLQPHSMRHAYACRLLRNGADLDAIRDALGHSSLLTTMIYLHTSTERKREVAQLAGRAAQKAEDAALAGRMKAQALPRRGRTTAWLE